MQLGALCVTLGVLVLPLVPLVLAWRRWLGIEGKVLGGSRKALFTVGIASISVACLGWLRVLAIRKRPQSAF